MTTAPEPSSGARLSRRALLGAFGAGAVTVAGVGTAAAVVRNAESEPQSAEDLRYDFYGSHQGGVTTPMQDQLHFAALDMTTDSRDALIALLQQWTTAAAAMMSGDLIGQFGAVNGPYDAPPQDTGEALDLPAAGLDYHLRVRADVIHDGRRCRPIRYCRPAAGGLEATSALSRRYDQTRDQRGRSLYPGVRQ